MDELPENVIQLSTFRRSGEKKRCQCYTDWENKDASFIVDVENREIVCGYCGEKKDPIEVFEILMEQENRLNDNVNRLYEQARELYNYKPRLKAAKEFESRVRGDRFVPVCPHCEKGILLEEMSYRSKEYELNRRAFAKEAGK